MTTDLAATPHDTTETLGSEDTAHTAAAFADRLFESLLGGLDMRHRLRRRPARPLRGCCTAADRSARPRWRKPQRHAPSLRPGVA